MLNTKQIKRTKWNNSQRITLTIAFTSKRIICNRIIWMTFRKSIFNFSFVLQLNFFFIKSDMFFIYTSGSKPILSYTLSVAIKATGLPSVLCTSSTCHVRTDCWLTIGRRIASYRGSQLPWRHLADNSLKRLETGARGAGAGRHVASRRNDHDVASLAERPDTLKFLPD